MALTYFIGTVFRKTFTLQPGALVAVRQICRVLRMACMSIVEFFSDTMDFTFLKPLMICPFWTGHNCWLLLQCWAWPLSDGSQLPFSATVTELKMCPTGKLEWAWHWLCLPLATLARVNLQLKFQIWQEKEEPFSWQPSTGTQESGWGVVATEQMAVWDEGR